MQLLRKLLCFLVVYIKVVFATTTIGAVNLCTSEISNPILQDSSSKYSYKCNNIESTIQLLMDLPTDVKELTIIDSNITEYDMDGENKKVFKSLKTIKVVRSYVGPALDWFYTLDTLQSLILVNSSTTFAINQDDTNLTVIDLKLKSFKNLQLLNVTGGNITQLDRTGVKSLPDLLLSGNRFECGQSFMWLLTAYDMKEVKVTLNNTVCFMKKIDERVSHPIIYTLTGKDFIPVMTYKREAKDNCPPKCMCELKGLLVQNRPQLNVECSNVNMTKLPDVIPIGSSRCNFSHNSIEDLTPLYTSNIYNSVHMMDMSHNNISYLDPVKFPDILRDRRDVGFFFNNNQLKKFPAEALKNVYEEARKKKQPYPPQFFLAYNPFLCSCDYIGHFQEMIYQNMYDIYDAREIRCAADDPNNPDTIILGLNVVKLCSPEESLFTTLDLLNLMLALLLVILTGDFVYNYLQYKKHRKLPWIVTKFKC